MPPSRLPGSRDHYLLFYREGSKWMIKNAHIGNGHAVANQPKQY
jgi:hypothetical protein